MVGEVEREEGSGSERSGAAALAVDPEWRRAFRSVESLVGGRVVAAQRQARWRPAWFLEVERDGEVLSLYFRGDRGQGQGGGGALEREMGVLQVLERHGIPVPHVFGFCEEPRGIVMERSPGRANLASAESEAERESVQRHYMELLARMHAIDPDEFRACRLAPPDAEEPVWIDFRRWEAGYRKATRAPEPLIELCIRWLRQSLPGGRRRQGFLTGDAGQFLFEGGRVTAVIDLELACLGDPLVDLGALRSRDVSEPLGDLSRAMHHYAEVSGEEISRSAVNFHAVRFALNTPLAVAPLCQRPPAGLDLVQYTAWKWVYGRLAVEVIAEEMGISLDGEGATRPLASADAAADVAAHDALLALLDGLRADHYEADAAYRVGQVLRERALHGDALRELDLHEAGEILGRRFPTAAESDEALQERILAPGFEIDAAVLRYLHRRALREESLLRPALRELADARFQKLRID